MKKIFTKSQSGFTLIELLVVIAIIAILSTIVLASLGTARQRARDTRAKSELSQMRAQAELFFTAGNTFVAVCTTAKSNNGLQEMLDSVSDNAALTGTDGGCSSDADTWAASALIKGDKDNSGNPKEFCVDSSGFAGFGTRSTSSPWKCALAQ